MCIYTHAHTYTYARLFSQLKGFYYFVTRSSIYKGKKNKIIKILFPMAVVAINLQ